ncbi:WhiB family transcriptional regulator [Actinomadura barringtoniae]|uniref:Transcriptional regulator WhiB n=2 Tax=Actinomadura barringtoniae TaxID=1427535 RepID=A0A939PKK2_9ACTN|nr:WhiB family transcriptional regulator [Actinomadura barringtoniae]MBO2453823.1 WhiB family transcriptional regulator [Actinomadura barringtoniae]
MDSWVDYARCRSADPELFFPIGPDELAAAKTFCRRCHVRQACLDFALDTGQRHGVWGGLDQDERRRLRRRARRAA